MATTHAARRTAGTLDVPACEHHMGREGRGAMAAVRDRPRHLTVRTEREEGGDVRVTVRDSGAGINPAGTERIFDAFYSTKRGGMGIGLSVSRSIVEGQHGRLWAEPGGGPGSTFVFTPPCRPGDAADVHPSTRTG